MALQALLSRSRKSPVDPGSEDTGASVTVQQRCQTPIRTSANVPRCRPTPLSRVQWLCGWCSGLWETIFMTADHLVSTRHNGSAIVLMASWALLQPQAAASQVGDGDDVMWTRHFYSENPCACFSRRAWVLSGLMPRCLCFDMRRGQNLSMGHLCLQCLVPKPWSCSMAQRLIHSQVA